MEADPKIATNPETVKLGAIQRKFLLRASEGTLEPTRADQRRVVQELVDKGFLAESEDFPRVFEITEQGEAALRVRS